MTNKELIKETKEKYGVKMFDKGSHNSLVMTTVPGEFKFLNIEQESNINHWINHASLNFFEHYSRGTYKIADLINMPKLIFYYDMYDEQSAIGSKVAWSILEREAPNYYRKSNIQFFYCGKGELEFADRADFGIQWGTVPALTLVDSNGRFFPFLEDTPFEDSGEF